MFFFPQVLKGRFHRIFSPSQSLDTVSPNDLLFCFEMLSKDLAKERVVLLKVQQVHHFHHLFFSPFSLRFVGLCQYCSSICCFFLLLWFHVLIVFVLIFRDLRFLASQSQSVLAAWSLLPLMMRSSSAVLAVTVSATAISEFPSVH